MGGGYTINTLAPKQMASVLQTKIEPNQIQWILFSLF